MTKTSPVTTKTNAPKTSKTNKSTPRATDELAPRATDALVPQATDASVPTESNERVGTNINSRNGQIGYENRRVSTESDAHLEDERINRSLGGTSITSENIVVKPKPTTSKEIIALKMFDAIRTV